MDRSIILLDKPAGPTSLECADSVRKMFGAKKAGHAGTLDPGVTGVLIIAIGEAVKTMPLLMNLPKEYEGVMHIHKDFSRQELRQAVESFTGKIIQTPPVISAVSRRPREREVYSFEVLSANGRDVSFRVSCQAGTYIRKLCSDLGEKLGTQAHMKSLRRTKAGPFSIKDCVTLQDLQKSPERFMIPIESALERLGTKRILIKNEFMQKVLNGSPILKGFIQKSEKGIRKGEFVGIFSGKRLIALATATQDGARIERVLTI